MSGYTEQELLSMHVADLEAMESTDDIRTHIQQIVAGGSARFETRHRRQDGSIFDIEVSVQYLPAYGGRIVAFLRDITERKQAEAALKGSLVEKEVLLQEIHHRTKNNMNVICGLLTLQSSYLDDDHTRQIFQETENRIRSMALVHDKLYQSKDLSKIDFGEYITDLANSLMANYQVSKEEISLRLEVENITVNIETAMPGGLIINELITNALKYAFPAERKGTISVSLKKSTDGAIDLRVADDGIGLPPDFDMRNTTSLGMKIITNIAEIQLQGTLELHKDRGTEIRLCFHEPHYEIRI
jgi:two-component sensor histidine kinase